MILFLSRNRKLLSLYFLGLFLISSNQYGNNLIVEAVKVAVGITIDDYKCKGHGCGCTTAFKCLTDCCCVFVDEPEEISVVCNPALPTEPEVKSCCSSEPEPKTFLEKADEIFAESLKDTPKIFLPSRCSADKFFSYQVSQGFLLDLFHDQAYSQEFLMESEWISKQDFTLQSFFKDLLKVPILG